MEAQTPVTEIAVEKEFTRHITTNLFFPHLAQGRLFNDTMATVFTTVE